MITLTYPSVEDQPSFALDCHNSMLQRSVPKPPVDRAPVN
jgi:hypothetical protein